jgi:hypothetical protein
MLTLVQRILGLRRSGRLPSEPIFKPYQAVSKAELIEVEVKVGAKLPDDFQVWLLTAGYGDIGEDLSFRPEWFKRVEQGPLRGALLFAQDTLGNFYAFTPRDERVVHFSRSTSEYAVLAPNFYSFVKELERRSFEVLQWVDSVDFSPYDWNA